MPNFTVGGIWRILTLTLILAVSSFAVGVLPLFFMFSNKQKYQLSTFGNGLLLGAALGIIIPEGIESVSATSSNATVIIAVSLVVGFYLMLLLEQYMSPHSPSNSHGYQTVPRVEQSVEYDMRPIDTDFSRGIDQTQEDIRNPDMRQRIAYPLTLGLVIHSLADGFALGASAAGEDSSDVSLSLVVFFALIIHKSPTALALTSSLLSTSIPRSEIRKHIGVFSVATPLGALFAYGVLGFAGSGTGSWTGVTLLISGGSFLYVATVIQPIGVHSHDGLDLLSSEGISKVQRLSLLTLGIFLPLIISSVLGHGHQHAH